MRRIWILLLLSCVVGAGVAWWRLNQGRLQSEEERKQLAVGGLGELKRNDRGDWRTKYLAETAEVDEMVTAALQDPTNTPEAVADLKATAVRVKSSQLRRATRLQLREIMLALKGYNSAYKRLGPDQSVRPQYFDAQGKLLVSWRVHILPLLGERALFDRFHLDEPHDSPNNKPLIEFMPDCYRAVDADDASTVTRILAVDGPGSLFEGGGFGNLDDVSDPKDETMLLLVVDPGSAVTWSQSNDFVVDPAAPLAALKMTDDALLSFLSTEGSVRELPPTITPEQFQGLISYQGGEPHGILEKAIKDFFEKKNAAREGQ